MFNNFKLIYRLLFLDNNAIRKIANKKSATADGILILFIAGVASIIGSRPLFEMEEYKKLAFDFTIENILSLSIFFVLISIGYIGFSFFISRLLGASCRFKQYFRNLAFLSILNLFNLSLNLATFAGIWILVVNYRVLKVLNNFTPFQSFLTLVSTFLSLFALMNILS